MGDEEAFLLLPLYLVLAASALALAYRVAARRAARRLRPFLLALPLAALRGVRRNLVPLDAGRARGSIALAFFVFPFAAGFALVARAPLADGCHARSLATLVALGVALRGDRDLAGPDANSVLRS